MRWVFVWMFGSLIHVSPAIAADVCKDAKVEADPFGGGKTVNAIARGAGNARDVSDLIGIEILSKGGAIELKLVLRQAGAVEGVVAGSVPVLVSLADGTTLELKTNRESPNVVYSFGVSVLTNLTYAVALDVAQVRTFATTEVNAMRLPHAGGSFDWLADKDAKKRLLSAASCVVMNQPAAATP